MSNTFDILQFIDGCIDSANDRLSALLAEVDSLRQSTKEGEVDRTEDRRRMATNLSASILDLRELRKQFHTRLAEDKISRRNTLLGLMRDMIADPTKYQEMEQRSLKTRLGAEITMHKWRESHPDNFEGGSIESRSDPYFMGYMPGDGK